MNTVVPALLAVLAAVVLWLGDMAGTMVVAAVALLALAWRLARSGTAEVTADRLVLVDGGTASEYAGSMEDYIDFVLGRNQPKVAAKGAAPAAKPSGASWEEMRELGKQVKTNCHRYCLHT